MGLQQLSIEDVQEQDLIWLMRALEGNLDGVEPQHVLYKVTIGLAQLWRVEAPGKGIFVTQLLEVPRGLKLEIWWMAGKGIIVQKEMINKDLRDFAKARGCFALSGNVIHKGLCWLYEKAFDAKPVSWIYYQFLDEVN